MTSCFIVTACIVCQHCHHTVSLSLSFVIQSAAGNYVVCFITFSFLTSTKLHYFNFFVGSIVSVVLRHIDVLL